MGLPQHNAKRVMCFSISLHRAHALAWESSRQGAPTSQITILAVLCLIATACQMVSSPALFELRAPDETGIRFINALQEDDSVHNALDFDYMYNGGGVGIGDVNNDGLQDLYFGGNMVSSRLYLNRGNLRFADVTEVAGVATD